MYTIKIILLCTLLILLGFACDNEKDPSLQDRLEAVLEQNYTDGYSTLFEGKNAGVYLTVRNSNTNVFASYNIDGMTSRTHFKGASTAKSFTAAAILLLHSQGLLDIDHRLTDLIPNQGIPYLPQTPAYDIPYKDEITMRMLLAHRAGVFDVTNGPMPDTIAAPYAGVYFTEYIKEQQGQTHTFTFDEMIEPVAAHQLFYFPPDSGMHYSNTGYQILGKIVERISGQSLTSFNKQHFLDPLGMMDTYFVDDGTQLVLQEPYLEDFLHYNGEVIQLPEDNLSSGLGGGGIVTTTGDLATWAQNLYGTTNILPADLISQMIEPRETGEHHVLYGLGCEMYPPEIGYGHNGANVAFMTVMRYHPSTQTVYVAGTNTFYLPDLQLELDMLNQIVRDAINVMSE